MNYEEEEKEEKEKEPQNEMHPMFQLLLFLGCFLGGGVLALFAVMGVGNIIGIQDVGYALQEIKKGNFIELLLPIKFLLMLSHLSVFAVPAFLFMRIVRPEGGFGFRRFSIGRLGLGVLGLFLSFPLVQWVYYANMQLFPPDAASLEAQALQKMLLEMPTAMHLVANLMLVGLCAGVGEELFFRGTLQPILMRLLRQNIHLAVWFTAVIFSLIHSEMQAFVPRLLLGALFGYAFWHSRSLWVPILMHVFFNSIQVVVAYFAASTGDAAQTPPVMISIGFTLSAAISYYFFFRKDFK